MSMKYIRDTYRVPAKRGARVEYQGNGSAKLGTITGTRNAHILVRLDGDAFSLAFHPTWKMRYIDAATLPVTAEEEEAWALMEKRV